jgi:hypothetical protein
MIRDELKALELHNATFKSEQDSLRSEINEIRMKAEMARMGGQSTQDQMKQDLFNNKILLRNSLLRMNATSWISF